MLDPTSERELARSLEAEPALIPWLAELLQDVWALGCHAEIVVDILARHGLTHDSEVLDLACGKGAISVPLARATGCHVTGVDLFDEFVRHASELARSQGLADRCTFVQGDLRELLAARTDVDAVVYASVGALGPPDRCIAALRRPVRAGGLIVIDDGFVEERTGTAPLGYEQYLSRQETRRALGSYGDEILGEVLVDREAALQENRRVTEQIRARALELCAREPRHADMFLRYVERQEAEIAYLDESFQDAVWLLRRGSD